MSLQCKQRAETRKLEAHMLTANNISPESRSFVLHIVRLNDEIPRLVALRQTAGNLTEDELQTSVMLW